MAAVFSDLPTETLHQIFSYFCLHCRGKHQSIPPDAHLRGTLQNREAPSWYSLQRHVLFSLCLVSRRFHVIAQPILYHEFIPGYGDSWRSALYSWDGRLTSFMRTVARRRDLAAIVERIYVHPYLLESVGEEEEECQDTLREAAHALRIEERQEISADNLIALLIALLPNLKHCSLQASPFTVNLGHSSTLRAAGISHLPLKSVDIALHAAPGQGLFTLEYHARAIFEISTCLETLNLHMCSGNWSEVPFPPLPNLKTLRITHSRLSEKALEGLLSSCNGLRRFTYEATSPRISPYDCRPNIYGEDHFTALNAVRYLTRHCATLESLHLDLRYRVHILRVLAGIGIPGPS